eukprot:4117148-Pyramimonas_sp.AAC.1
MVGQLPWATVITLCRQTDLLKFGGFPSAVSPVCPIAVFGRGWSAAVLGRWRPAHCTRAPRRTHLSRRACQRAR